MKISGLVLAAVLMLEQTAHAQEPVPTQETIGNEPPAGPTAPTDRVSLSAALERVDAQATSVRLANLSLERARVSERSALAAVLPEVTAGLAYTRYDQEVSSNGLVIRDENDLDGQISVGITLSALGIHAQSMADTATQVAQHGLADAKRLARGAAATVYMSVLAARNGAALARSQRQKAFEQLDAVRVRHRAGVATGLDEMRAELAVLELDRRVVEADGVLERTWDLLGEALGVDHPVDAEDSNLESAVSSLASISELERRASERPDVAESRATRTLAEQTLTDAWLRFVPALTASWTGSWASSTTTFSPESTSWYALLSLSIPLYDGGERYAAKRDAELVIAQAEEQEASLLRAVRNQIRDAHRRLSTATRAKALAAQSLATATRALEAADTAYRAGAATGIELADARRDREAAELAVHARTLEMQLALVDLLTATGEL